MLIFLGGRQMIEIAICDDNEKDQEIIQKFVVEYMNEKNFFHTIWTYKTGEELLESEETFNVVFLDIAMGDGMNGIIAGRKLRSISRKTKIIWNELLDKMKLSYDFWEEEFIGDFDFLKYICENEWSRKSFLKCIKDDFALHETIYNTRFVLIYVNMKKYIEFYIKEDVTFWKGIVFDKIRETFQKKMEIYDYLFELWYDLVVDLNGNKEKQYMMISSLSLNALAQMEYEKHLDELRKIDYFYIMHKSIRLYDSISSSNYVAFSNYWRSDTDYKVWFLENVLEAVSDRNDTDIQLFKLKVGMFLKQIKKNSDNLPEYYMQKIAADNIIRCIESGKNTELYTYWEKVKEMTNK